MEIVNVRVSTLKNYNNNTKEHPAEQVKEIAKSIERFGFRQPIVVDRNNVVVIGHGRLLAAKELHLKEVPVTVADDLTDDEINALRLVDNKTNESAWDFSALEAELVSIGGIDMSDFGFEPISEAEVENATRPPEKAPERGWHADEPSEPVYTQRRPQGEYEHLASIVNDRPAVANPVTWVTPLQPTNWDKENDWVEEQGMELVGRRSLTEADGGSEYRYVCPRCKHRFN